MDPLGSYRNQTEAKTILFFLYPSMFGVSSFKGDVLPVKGLGMESVDDAEDIRGITDSSDNFVMMDVLDSRV